MRFRIRYNLRSLLVAVTLAAIALWAIPAWREYHQRNEFEEAAQALVAGPEPDFYTSFPSHASKRMTVRAVFFDSSGNAVVGIPVRYEHGWYCIYAQTEKLSKEESRALEIQKAEALRAAVQPGVIQQPRSYGMPARTPSRWRQVWVYRLDPMPQGYSAKSTRGKQNVLDGETNVPRARTPLEQYMADFYEIIAGRERADLGVDFELIHSDPAAATKPDVK